MQLSFTSTLVFGFFLFGAMSTPPSSLSTMDGIRSESHECPGEAVSLLQRAARLKEPTEPSSLETLVLAARRSALSAAGEESMAPRSLETMLTEDSGVYSIGRPLKEGERIALIADGFDNEHGFAVQFLDADGEEATEFKVKPQKRHVARNTRVAGKWGQPIISSEDDYPSVLQHPGKTVRMDFEWATSGWRAYVDGVRQKELDLPRETKRPVAVQVRGTMVNAHVVLAVPNESFGAMDKNVTPGHEVLPHRRGDIIKYTLPRVMTKGDAVHLTADGWEKGDDWSIKFHDRAGNVAFSWSPHRKDEYVARNMMTKGFEPGSQDIWGLKETGGQWPFLYGTKGEVNVLFEWTWSFWATSVDGIRRPDLDFYHRTLHPISSVTLTTGLNRPKVSFHHARQGSPSLSASRPDGCDAAGELPLPVVQQIAPGSGKSASLHASSGLHRVVGTNGVLVLTLARKPERLTRAVGALGKVGIVPVPFPATDAECASPDELDLGIRRIRARQRPSVALVRADKARQTPEQWWRETKVAQAIADSHRRALQAALARPGAEWTAILEDDAVPAGGARLWDESFTKAWAAVPKSAKFVRLGWCGTGPPYDETFNKTDGSFKVGQWKQPKAHEVDRKSQKGDSHASDGGCTTAYLVHRSIIPRMLQLFPCTEALDSCFLWSLFMTLNDEGNLWGADNMVNIDVDAKKLDAHEAAKHARRQNLSYIQAGVLQQARDVPSTRRLATW